MILIPAIGSCITFIEGYGQFLADRLYAIVGLHSERLLLVEIDFTRRSAARYLHKIERSTCLSLESEGRLKIVELPPLPRPAASSKPTRNQVEKSKRDSVKWHLLLSPMIDDAHEIFSAPIPEKAFNDLARAHNLHQSRARERFFWLAAYGFDEDCLKHAYWNCGKAASSNTGETVPAKRGRPVKDKTITLTGWAKDAAWEATMLSGWKTHSSRGKSYKRVYLQVLTEFGCIVDTSTRPSRIFHPQGNTFPTWMQFSTFIKQSVGIAAWKAAKYGEQTLRNHAGNAINKVQQFLVNLLEEVQWDAQILEERPGDLLDPSQPGKAIVRVVAICGTCGGPVGVGYDYGAESHWAYLMALLSMAMRKSEFCDLFGVEISDSEWPAIGLMLAVRGDRGPAIGQKVSDIIAKVLEIWQEWAASYDPVGKPNAEAGHHKTIKIEGTPRRTSRYRTPMEIIREDLRKTVAAFRASDMSHRLDPEQAKHLERGSPLQIWNDLVSRRLYAGQHVSIQKLIKFTMPRHEIKIRHDGIYLGGLRYLSPELIDSGILERARGQAMVGHAYALNLTVKRIWFDNNNSLLCLEAIPVRINAMEATHSLTLEESLLYQQYLNRSRRAAEEEHKALMLANEIEMEKERRTMESVRKNFTPQRSSGKKHTAEQHERVFKRKT